MAKDKPENSWLQKATKVVWAGLAVIPNGVMLWLKNKEVFNKKILETLQKRIKESEQKLGPDSEESGCFKEVLRQGYLNLQTALAACKGIKTREIVSLKKEFLEKKFAFVQMDALASSVQAWLETALMEAGFSVEETTKMLQGVFDKEKERHWTEKLVSWLSEHAGDGLVHSKENFSKRKVALVKNLLTEDNMAHLQQLCLLVRDMAKNLSDPLQCSLEYMSKTGTNKQLSKKHKQQGLLGSSSIPIINNIDTLKDDFVKKILQKVKRMVDLAQEVGEAAQKILYLLAENLTPPDQEVTPAEYHQLLTRLTGIAQKEEITAPKKPLTQLMIAAHVAEIRWQWNDAHPDRQALIESYLSELKEVSDPIKEAIRVKANTLHAMTPNPKDRIFFQQLFYNGLQLLLAYGDYAGEPWVTTLCRGLEQGLETPLLAIVDKKLRDVILGATTIDSEEGKNLITLLSERADTLGISKNLLDAFKESLVVETKGAQALKKSSVIIVSSEKIAPFAALDRYLWNRAEETRQWYYLASNWRKRLDDSLVVYNHVLSFLNSTPINPVPDADKRKTLDLKDQKTALIASLGWMQLKYGGIWVDRSLFFNLKKGIRLKKLLPDVLRFAWSLLRSGLNILRGLFFRNEFANRLRDIRLMISVREFAPNPSTQKITTYLTLVIKALSAMQQDIQPSNKDSNFATYVTRESPENKVILQHFGMLQKVEMAQDPRVEQWNDDLQGNKQRPSLKKR